MSNSYSFQLSSAEFYWLTRIFGLNRLPLLDSTQRISSLPGSAVLSEAQSSLQARGFIRKDGDLNWQVDRLPAAIIRWLDEAEWMLSVQHCTRDGSQRRANLFIKEEAGLSMTAEAGGYRLTIYPDRAALIENMLDWLANPFPKKIRALPTYSMPQPEEVIPIVWEDSIRATKAFALVQLTSQQLKNTLAWIETLQWFASIAHVQLSNDIAHFARRGVVNKADKISKPNTYSLRRTAQIIVCADKKNIWGASGATNNIELFSLSSVNRKDLITQIQNLL